MTLNDLIRKAGAVASSCSSGDLELRLLDAFTEAHGRPVRDIRIDPYSEAGTIRVLISFKTAEPPRRMTADDRLREIADWALARSPDPFMTRNRNEREVAARQCVFLMLRNEGYKLHEIAEATGFHHSTVVWGIRHAKDLIGVGDPLYTRTWNYFQLMDGGMP